MNVSATIGGCPNERQPHLAADKMNVSHTYFAADAKNECQPHTINTQTLPFGTHYCSLFRKKKQMRKIKYGHHQKHQLFIEKEREREKSRFPDFQIHSASAPH